MGRMVDLLCLLLILFAFYVFLGLCRFGKLCNHIFVFFIVYSSTPFPFFFAMHIATPKTNLNSDGLVDDVQCAVL